MRDCMPALFVFGDGAATTQGPSTCHSPLRGSERRSGRQVGASHDSLLHQEPNLGRYFFGAALLAEFLEEFFLAERIGAV